MQWSAKRIAVAVALVPVTLLYGLLLWQGPWWIDGAHLRKTNLQPADGVVVTGVRTMLVALGVGALTAIGLYYTRETLKHNQEKDKMQAELTRQGQATDAELTRQGQATQAELTREGQVTERYVEATKLLSADDSLTQRLGGIYALERIMWDSQRDHRTVIEVLTAFIRQGPSPESFEDGGKARPGRDLQAALTVLGRMPVREGSPLRIDLGRASLHEADMFEACFDGVNLNLGGAHLESANLGGAQLNGANLSSARLDDAHLDGAQLNSANLVQSSLRSADLAGAVLDGANLVRANLEGAKLTGASLAATQLDGAYLAGADLRGASSYTVKSFLTARITSSTWLPESVSKKPEIQAHISECESRTDTLAPEAVTDDCDWEASGRGFPHEVILRSIY